MKKPSGGADAVVNGVPQPVWRMSPFIVSHALAALIVVSWIWPPMSGWWTQIDLAVFTLLNGSLKWSEEWQFFWALANHRNVDFFSGGLAAIVGLWWVWGEPRAVQNGRAAAFCAIALPVMITPFVVHFLLEYVFPFKRASPTITMEGAVRLTKLVPSIVTKDASRSAFPGDHAFVLFSVIMFYWYLAERKFVWISVLMGVVFMAPRLVSGAHWLTDNVVGGIAPALIVTSWVLATPIAFYLMKTFLPVINLVIRVLPGWLRIPDYSEK